MAEKQETNLEKFAKSMKNLKDAFKDTGTELEKITNKANQITLIVTGLKDLSEIEIGDNVIEMLKDMGEKFISLGEVIPKASSYLTEFSKEVLKSRNLLEGFGNFISNHEEAMSKWGTAIKEKAKSSFDSVKGKLGEFKKGLSNAFTSFKNDPFGAISKGLTSLGALANKVFIGSFATAIAVVVATIAGLVLYFKELMERNEAFKESVESAWSKVTDAFSPAIEAFEAFKNTIFGESEDGEDTIPPFVQVLLDMITMITESLALATTEITTIIVGIFDFLTGLLTEKSEEGTSKVTEFMLFIKEIFSTVWSAITEIFSLAWDAIGAILSVGIDAFNVVWDIFGEDIIAIFQTVWDTVGGILSGAVDIIQGILEIIVGLFTLNFSKIGSGVRSALGGVKDIFSSIFKGIINFAIDKINFFIRKLNSVISFAKNIPGLSSLVGELHISTIPKLAGGGLVVPGQLFIAREAGPELVASFGSKTAVMNNNQIVASVKQGVYEAVTDALRGNVNSGQPMHIHLNLDGREITRTVIKGHNSIVKQTGMSPLHI